MILKTEKIVTAFAEYAAGPGWANRPLWVIVRGADQRLRMHCSAFPMRRTKRCGRLLNRPWRRLNG